MTFYLFIDMTLTITSSPLDLYPDSITSMRIPSARIQTGPFTGLENCKNMKKTNDGFLWAFSIFAALMLLFTACDPQPGPEDYEEGVSECFSWNEGNHSPRGYNLLPPKFRIEGTRFYGWEFRVRFQPSGLYFLNSQDSLDWNKGYVLSDDNLRANKSMLSPAWRSRDGETFDAAWYGNQDFQKVLPDEGRDVLRGIKPGREIVYRVVYDLQNKAATAWIYYGNQSPGDGIVRIFNLVYEPNIFWLFDPWFGGTSKAPRDLRPAFCVDALLFLGENGQAIVSREEMSFEAFFNFYNTIQ
jgi:hypothetical protein